MEIFIDNLNGNILAAATENRQIKALEIDPEAELIRWGSVYWGKVARIDKAQNAAYIDLGYGFTGILYASDVVKKDMKKPKTPVIGKLINPGEMIAVQVKTARTPMEGDQEDRGRSENKASVVSMDISLPGRYMIYTPLSDQNRISKRITDPKLRDDLKDMLASIDAINGCILRASAANCQTDILIREGKILRAIWDSLTSYMEGQEAGLLMLGPDAIQRILSDLASKSIDKIEVINDEVYEELTEWCELYAPELKVKINDRRAEDKKKADFVPPTNLLEEYDLLSQMDTFLVPYVMLQSGGFLLIEDTSAMTVIDVNSSVDKNPYNCNLEAIIEIAQQLRVRNISGTIVVDCISTKDKDQRQHILDKLKECVANDPCTVTVHGWTKLGLIEISRQRRAPTLLERVTLLGMVEEI